MDEITVIDVFYIFRLALHMHMDSLGSPDTHTLGLQLRQLDPAGAVAINVGVFFCHIFLFPEESADSLDGNTPGFLFDHSNHLMFIIQQVSAKRKMKNY